MMEAVLGPLPEGMARHATRSAAKYFTHRHHLNWPAGAASRKSVRAVAKMRGLRESLAAGCDSSMKPHIDSLVRSTTAHVRLHSLTSFVAWITPLRHL